MVSFFSVHHSIETNHMKCEEIEYRHQCNFSFFFQRYYHCRAARSNRENTDYWCAMCCAFLTCYFFSLHIVQLNLSFLVHKHTHFKKKCQIIFVKYNFLFPWKSQFQNEIPHVFSSRSNFAWAMHIFFFCHKLSALWLWPVGGLCVFATGANNCFVLIDALQLSRLHESNSPLLQTIFSAFSSSVLCSCNPICA